jgi:hypothetical protein
VDLLKYFDILKAPVPCSGCGSNRGFVGRKISGLIFPCMPTKPTLQPLEENIVSEAMTN